MICFKNQNVYYKNVLNWRPKLLILYIKTPYLRSEQDLNDNKQNVFYQQWKRPKTDLPK